MKHLEVVEYDKNIHDELDSCILCGRIFDSYEDLVNLLDVFGKGNLFICQECLNQLEEDIKEAKNIIFRRNKI